MFEDLKARVLRANLDLVKHGLVIFTWGNVSMIDESRSVVAIKPSGVSYETMQVSDIVLLSLSGEKIEGALNPSSDTPTHLRLYSAFPEIGGIAHTHSCEAVAWAQAGRGIPNLGTTHSDYFYGEIPCTDAMTADEIRGDYEAETGNVIIRTLRSRKINPKTTPAALVRNHGPFAWGKDAEEAVHNAAVLEEIARMARLTLQVNPVSEMNELLTEKHFSRKHGAHSYYGQKKN